MIFHYTTGNAPEFSYWHKSRHKSQNLIWHLTNFIQNWAIFATKSTFPFQMMVAIARMAQAD
jgi:hypothetical protein